MDMNKILKSKEELELHTAINYIDLQYKKIINALSFIRGYNEGLFMSDKGVSIKAIKDTLDRSFECLDKVQATIESILSIYGDISRLHLEDADVTQILGFVGI